MTLKEGISMLMSSDATNNALTHESWTDGRYIQCAPLKDNDQVRIRVFSRLDENLNYTEEPFRRKDFANIKDYGWHIISPEGLVQYAMNQTLKKKSSEPVKSDNMTYSHRPTYGKTLPGELKLQVINLVEDWADGKVDSDEDFNLIMQKLDEYIDYYQTEYNLYQDLDHVNNIFLKFTTDWIVQYISKADNPRLYRQIHNLGLTTADLGWVHKMELENGILVDVDDLEDFDNMAAVSVVKKRIRNALDKKN